MSTNKSMERKKKRYIFDYSIAREIFHKMRTIPPYLAVKKYKINSKVAYLKHNCHNSIKYKCIKYYN